MKAILVVDTDDRQSFSDIPVGSLFSLESMTFLQDEDIDLIPKLYVKVNCVSYVPVGYNPHGKSIYLDNKEMSVYLMHLQNWNIEPTGVRINLHNMGVRYPDISTSVKSFDSLCSPVTNTDNPGERK